MAGRVAYSGNTVTQGLILNLDAAVQGSYPKTGSLWIDISGNENRGTLTNGAFYSSSDYGSITFDGINDYVSIQNNVNPSNITLEFFFKVSITSSYQYLISNARDCCGAYNGYELRIESGTPMFQIWNSVNAAVYGTLAPLNQNYHLAATYDGSQLKIYQNSVLRGTLNSTLGIGVTPSYTLAVGGMGFNPAAYNFSGSIYVGKVYNRALSQAEITQNFNAYRSRYGI
jgi:hypothetical protein